MENTNLPPEYRKPLKKDYTTAYAGSINRFPRIPADSLSVVPREGEAVYLCLASRESWVPVGYGRFENDTVRFDNVQGAVVFRMVIYRDGRMISLGEPFELNKQSGALRFFRASDVRQKAVFLQKFKEDFQAHMVGGVFEADNRADFRNPDTLHVITGRPPRLMNVVRLPDDTKAYRYVRYYGPPTRHCNISELAFFAPGAEGDTLRGRVISPPGVNEGRIVNQFHNVFDGDPYTSMDYREPSGGWVGLDFDGLPRAVRRMGRLGFRPPGENREDCLYTTQPRQLHPQGRLLRTVLCHGRRMDLVGQTGGSVRLAGL